MHGYHGCASRNLTASLTRADYDIVGLWMAWQYGLARDVLTTGVMTRLANQMQSSIWKPKWGASLAYHSHG